MVNRPQGLRDANERAFVSWFPNCTPPTLIPRSLKQLKEFISEHGRVVVKPIDEGSSVGITICLRDEGLSAALKEAAGPVFQSCKGCHEGYRVEKED